MLENSHQKYVKVILAQSSDRCNCSKKTSINILACTSEALQQQCHTKPLRDIDMLIVNVLPGRNLFGNFVNFVNVSRNMKGWKPTFLLCSELIQSIWPCVLVTASASGDFLCCLSFSELRDDSTCQFAVHS